MSTDDVFFTCAVSALEDKLDNTECNTEALAYLPAASVRDKAANQFNAFTHCMRASAPEQLAILWSSSHRPRAPPNDNEPFCRCL